MSSRYHEELKGFFAIGFMVLGALALATFGHYLEFGPTLWLRGALSSTCTLVVGVSLFLLGPVLLLSGSRRRATGEADAASRRIPSRAVLPPRTMLFSAVVLTAMISPTLLVAFYGDIEQDAALNWVALRAAWSSSFGSKIKIIALASSPGALMWLLLRRSRYDVRDSAPVQWIEQLPARFRRAREDDEAKRTQAGDLSLSDDESTRGALTPHAPEEETSRTELL